MTSLSRFFGRLSLTAPTPVKFRLGPSMARLPKYKRALFTAPSSPSVEGPGNPQGWEADYDGPNVSLQTFGWQVAFGNLPARAYPKGYDFMWMWAPGGAQPEYAAVNGTNWGCFTNFNHLNRFASPIMRSTLLPFLRDVVALGYKGVGMYSGNMNQPVSDYNNGGVYRLCNTGTGPPPSGPFAAREWQDRSFRQYMADGLYSVIENLPQVRIIGLDAFELVLDELPDEGLDFLRRCNANGVPVAIEGFLKRTNTAVFREAMRFAEEIATISGGVGAGDITLDTEYIAAVDPVQRQIISRFAPASRRAFFCNNIDWTLDQRNLVNAAMLRGEASLIENFTLRQT